MKVPTYQRQTAMTQEVGGRAMSVQASPSAASAGTRAAQQFFDQATQASLQWYETELTNQRRVQKRKADIASEEEMLKVVQDSSEMNPNEAETYFDTEMEVIKRNYSEQFDNDLQRQNFELDFDKRALAKRVAVRSDASERRIGDALATYEMQRDQIQSRIINASTELDRLIAQDDLDKLFAEIQDSGYLTPTDVNRQRVASDQFVTKESYIARINRAKSVEAQRAIIEELEDLGNLPILPSTLRTLVNKSEDEIAEIMAAENRTKALEDALAAEVSEEQRFALENQIDKMSPAQVSAWLDLVSKDDYAALRGRLDISDIRALKQYANARAEKSKSDLAAQKAELNNTYDGFDALLEIGKLPPQVVVENAFKTDAYINEDGVSDRGQAIVEKIETTRLVRTLPPSMVEQYQKNLEQQIDNSALVQELFLLDPEEMEFENRTQASLARQLKLVSDYRVNLDKAVDDGQHIQFYAEAGQMQMPDFDLSNIPQSIANVRSAFTSVAGILGQGLEPEERPSLRESTRGVNFFTDAQAAEVNKYISGATPAEKSALASQLQPATSFAPQIWEQIAESGSKTFAIAGAINQPIIAEQIFLGEAIIADKTQVTPTKSQVISIFNDRVGNVGEVYGQENHAATLSAVLAHYAATRSDPSESDVNESEFLRSIDAVTGGIGEHNGFKVELPRGVNEDTFNAWMEGFSPRMVEYFAPEGIQGMTYEEAADMVKRSRLMGAADNAYIPVFDTNNMGAVFRKNGDELVISWNSSMEKILAEERVRAGEDARISTDEERWLFLSGRPTGFLDVYEREELFNLEKQFGRASNDDILRFKAERLESQNRMKEAEEVRSRIRGE